MEPGQEETQAPEEQAPVYPASVAFQGWRPFHAHKHPSQDFLDHPPIISDQSVPGTAAVHGLDFFL